MRTVLRLLRSAILLVSAAGLGWFLYGWLAEWLGEPKEPPRPAPVDVAGVQVTDPVRVLAFANEAPSEVLARAGLARAPLAALLSARPFRDVEELAGTSGIGPKTLEALIHAAT